jgi:UDPglucose 6-dehydrogenase
VKIAVFGTGYVGLVSGTCLAEMGNTVTCVDIDAKKINLLKDGVVPIYEPGLEDLVMKNTQAHRLLFTTDLKNAVEENEILMIAVGTPPNEDGSADLKHVLSVAQTIGTHMNGTKVVVTKSTVPVSTGDKVTAAIQKALDSRGQKLQFSVASNPEFLKEGAAVQDFMKPDRIVVGAQDKLAKDKLEEMYRPFVLNGHRMIVMDIRSAELTKYASNAMLATKISFMNELSRVAEKVGADVAAVRQGMGSDARIGFHFTYPGVGYGGSCFPKDVKALVRTSREMGLKSELLDAVESVNESQRTFFFDKILAQFSNNLKNKHFAVWGLSFKPETDDIREAPALDIIKLIIDAGGTVTAHDPIANAHVQEHFKNTKAVRLFDDQYETLRGADALLLMTEWKPFRSPDFAKVKELLRSPLIFDGRNQYDLEQMRTLGFGYHSIGRPTIKMQ